MSSCCPISGSFSSKDAAFNTFASKSGTICKLCVSDLIVSNSLTIVNNNNNNNTPGCAAITTVADTGSAITVNCVGDLITNAVTQNVFQTTGTGTSSIDVGFRPSACEPTLTQWNDSVGQWQFAPPPGETVVTAGGAGMFASVTAAILASPCAPFVRVVGDLAGVDTNASLNAAIVATTTTGVVIYIDPGRTWAPTITAPVDLQGRSFSIRGNGPSSVLDLSGGVLAGLASFINVGNGLNIENITLFTQGPIVDAQNPTRIHHTTVNTPAFGTSFIGTALVNQIVDTLLADVIIFGSVGPVIIGTAVGAGQGLQVNGAWFRGAIAGTGINVTGPNIQLNNIFVTSNLDITLSGGGMITGLYVESASSVSNVVLGADSHLSNARITSVTCSGSNILLDNIVCSGGLTLIGSFQSVSNIQILTGGTAVWQMSNSFVSNFLHTDATLDTTNIGTQNVIENLWTAGFSPGGNWRVGVSNSWSNISTPSAVIIAGNDSSISNFDNSFNAISFTPFGNLNTGLVLNNLHCHDITFNGLNTVQIDNVITTGGFFGGVGAIAVRIHINNIDFIGVGVTAGRIEGFRASVFSNIYALPTLQLGNVGAANSLSECQFSDFNNKPFGRLNIDNASECSFTNFACALFIKGGFAPITQCHFSNFSSNGLQLAAGSDNNAFTNFSIATPAQNNYFIVGSNNNILSGGILIGDGPGGGLDFIIVSGNHNQLSNFNCTANQSSLTVTGTDNLLTNWEHNRAIDCSGDRNQLNNCVFGPDNASVLSGNGLLVNNCLFNSPGVVNVVSGNQSTLTACNAGVAAGVGANFSFAGLNGTAVACRSNVAIVGVANFAANSFW